MDGYDIIGDIHGRELELRVLLERLGYQRQDGVWRHPQRKTLFIGDFIDRHPARGVLAIDLAALAGSGRTARGARSLA